jgi:hypothetical protein
MCIRVMYFLVQPAHKVFRRARDMINGCYWNMVETVCCAEALCKREDRVAAHRASNAAYIMHVV